VCVCVCARVCTFACVCVFTCVNVSVGARMHECKCVSVCARMSAQMWLVFVTDCATHGLLRKPSHHPRALVWTSTPAAVPTRASAPPRQSPDYGPAVLSCLTPVTEFPVLGEGWGAMRATAVGPQNMRPSTTLVVE